MQQHSKKDLQEKFMHKPFLQPLKVICTMSAALVFLVFCGAASAKPVSPDFVELAKKGEPAVVNISTTKTISSQAQSGLPSENDGSNPFDEFFGRFFNQAPSRPQKVRSLGSGFIISEDGYILTNYHVIAGADEIKVKLSDSREFKAVVKGRDEKLDLALLKVDVKGRLPVAPLGDSDALQVGEWVMAIGNPFGLGQTVTAGIVSAKGRIIGSGPYDDFIQTDASINPGNSGGPLFNTMGEVVGINTAIVAGGQGIGFAIPINMAKEIITQLKTTGKVTRGWFGVAVQAVTPELAKSFGLKESTGVLISQVMKGSPAEKAGLKTGDIITEFDGKPIREMHELPRIAANLPVGKKAIVKIIRNGKAEEKTVIIEKMKEGEENAASLQGKLGFMATGLDREVAERMGINQTHGVVVTQVTPGSAAEEAGMAAGDIITQIDNTKIETMDDFNRLVESHKSGDFLRFLLRRGDSSLFVALKLE
jgi:serine protease Do